MWTERAGVEAAVAEKGWGARHSTPLVSEVSYWVLTFAFCGLRGWLLQCSHLWFVVVLFGFLLWVL